VKLAAYRVARELGKFVDEVLDHCTAKDLWEWIVFLNLKQQDFAKPATPEDELKSFFRHRPKGDGIQ
jgi:hypothetical protein